MSKIVAIIFTGLFAAGAYAQNPANTTSQEQVITNSKQQDKAQAKVDARPQGNVKKPVGDTAKSEELNPVGSGGKAAAAGEARIDNRDARRPNRQPAKQGGTPDMAGAK